MVALKKYARIEATGLWRSTADAQRREVIVVLGDATLTIMAPTEKPLAHWSIAAIERANPGEDPAQYHPAGDPSEVLELPADETAMLEAIETLRLTVERARPHPGRLRWLGFVLSGAAVLAVALLWLPAALRDHALDIVPDVGRAEIGQALLTRVQRVTGPACGTSANTSSLAALGQRLEAPRLAVMRGGLDGALHLPGGQILISRRLVEDFEEPDVVAGYILRERHSAAVADPLRAVLDHGGLRAAFGLLTTGTIDARTLDSYARAMLTGAGAPPDDEALIQVFAAASVRSTPFAYARDITGETVLSLIEGDPMRGTAPTPILSDADWLRLQAICTD